MLLSPAEAAAFGAAFAVEYLRRHAERPTSDSDNVVDAAIAATEVIDRMHDAAELLVSIRDDDGRALSALRAAYRIKEAIR